MVMPSWQTEDPTRGYMLVDKEEIVGVYLAFHSQRLIAGTIERFCNLSAFCVQPEYRAQGMLLLRTIVRREGLHLTDFSPSGNVIALNKRLGFKCLDTSTALLLNFPALSQRVRIITDRGRIREMLSYRERKIFDDHQNASAAIHLLATDGADYCYVIARRDRRKRLRIFASILFVSDQAAFARFASQICASLLRYHRALATLAELRVVGTAPKRSKLLKHSRPKMFKSSSLSSIHVDYLYSELTNVAW